jgi:nucleoside-diphosphate kinase
MLAQAYRASVRPLVHPLRTRALASAASASTRTGAGCWTSWRHLARSSPAQRLAATGVAAAAGLSVALLGNSTTTQCFSKPNNKERTYIMIKPDGVQRGLIGNIVQRFEQRGYKLVALKMTTPSVAHLKAHYADLSKKPFFPSLIEYMASGPVVCMVWEGSFAVKTGRVLLGETNPADSTPGSIRGDYCIEVGRNICHGSDAVESAEHEIALWFPEGVNSYQSCAAEWIFE